MAEAEAAVRRLQVCCTYMEAVRCLQVGILGLLCTLLLLDSVFHHIAVATQVECEHQLEIERDRCVMGGGRGE